MLGAALQGITIVTQRLRIFESTLENIVRARKSRSA